MTSPNPIRSIDTFVVGAGRRNWVLVRVSTADEVGWGEATIELHTADVVAAVETLSGIIEGEDASRIEYLWQVMYRQRFFNPGIVATSAIGAINQALWDIKARRLGVPVWDLWGGRVRDRIRMYDHLGGGAASAVYGEIDPQGFADAVLASMADGFTACKILAVPSGDPVLSGQELSRVGNVVDRVVEAMGGVGDLMVDVHGRCSPASALQVGAVLADHQLLFVEELMHPRYDHELERVAAQLPRFPIAAGERLLSRREFLPIASAVSVAQPDVVHAGGPSELLRIASLMDTYGVSMAPHNPLGPLATVVNLHLAAVMPNFLIQEVMRADVGFRSELVGRDLTVTGGFADIPTGIGWGIEVDLDAVAAHPPVVEPMMRSFRTDGSVTDW